MAQPTSQLEEAQDEAQRTAPLGPSAAPASPTKSLWKRLLNRSASAHPEPSAEQIAKDTAPNRTPSPALQPVPGGPPASAASAPLHAGAGAVPKPTGSSRRAVREVVPNFPRTQTFDRQQSELRQNLLPVMPSHDERRVASVDRRRARSVSSPTSSHVFSSPRTSVPNIPRPRQSDLSDLGFDRAAQSQGLGAAFRVVPPVPSVPSLGEASGERESHDGDGHDSALSPSQRASLGGDQLDDYLDHRPLANDALKESYHIDTSSMTSSQYEQRIRYELEHVWILNLSMHFRDKSRREKFFVTYRQRPDLSRRVTVSLDYRNAPEGSLEMDLLDTKLQRDKNEMIYEAIRESLVDIQFYNTVTNLKLQTTDGRLHVHVVEDVSEIIDYPPSHCVQHLGCRKIREHDVEFDSHMSGFVYKVRVEGRTLIKKEIPGPDSVDEFLYEVNALNFLRGSRSVIELYGIVIGDNDRVKGLLISYAEQGALIDILYENNHGLPWPTRMKWARQIVLGLSEVHEAGFVQGDFTLSNIVIDDDGNAKIIDINRRGCPVGWEPPEATPLIQSDQRISMYIGVKSDLYQLGMVLWALATQHDDPEAHGRPLLLGGDADVPRWYRTVVETCLADDPRVRAQARQLLSCFPTLHNDPGRLDDSDYDDDWVERPHSPVFYTHSPQPSASVDDANTSGRDRAGIESAPSSDYYIEDEVSFVGDAKDLSAEKLKGLAPRIKTVTPSQDWASMSFGHTYVDPLNGVSNEPYYFPTRGRSPPSHTRLDLDAVHDPSERVASWTRTVSQENQSPDRSSVGRPGRAASASNSSDHGRKSTAGQEEEACVLRTSDAEIGLSEDANTVAEAAEARTGASSDGDSDTPVPGDLRASDTGSDAPETDEPQPPKRTGSSVSASDSNQPDGHEAVCSAGGETTDLLDGIKEVGTVIGDKHQDSLDT